jgi:hypothetical protein
VSRIGDPEELPADDAGDDEADMAELLEPADPVNDRPDAKVTGARARRR